MPSKVSRVSHSVDPSFLALPLHAAADAALQAARDAGATHADLRVERIRNQDVSLRDARLQSLSDDVTVGLAVRVVHDGTWGFASSPDVTVDEAVRLAGEAVAMARTARPLNSQPVELAEEPVYPNETWVSDYEIDPFSVDPAEKVALFEEWSRRLLSHDEVDHVDVHLQQAMEGKFYADTAGTTTTQQRVRLYPQVEGTRVDPGGGFETMRTIAPPVGRGWEYLTSGYDWAAELEQMPEHLVEKAKASSVEPGRYDLVIDPSNLWLTIHESIGHATELDRALGYEAAYAGTSFATIDQLGSLRYGTDLMHVTGDRHTPHGLSTVGWDDEGVAAQQWDLIKDGTLVGYQLDRRMARQNAGVLGVSRSNGCAYADGAHRVPVQRMPNVSLQPDPKGPSLEDLIGGVEKGIYVVGDKSWSIDMQRYNFQFTGQRFYEIRGGRLVGQLRDVAYQATTTEFWGSMEVVGGPQTYVLGGAFNCGKAQPSQTAAVSHGCPAALFRGVNILNTVREAGR
ncbi:MAG: peptidase modulator of gyrase [Frankiales bacterium]|nr:peptidase modulator of gyrase [Frankiales bacterium]